MALRRWRKEVIITTFIFKLAVVERGKERLLRTVIRTHCGQRQASADNRDDAKRSIKKHARVAARVLAGVAATASCNWHAHGR